MCEQRLFYFTRADDNELKEHAYVAVSAFLDLNDIRSLVGINRGD